MSTGLVLIVTVAGAYLAAHSLSEVFARRFLIVSGAEYLLLGVLLGPQVSGVIQASTVGDFAPFLTLAFGWIGALVGAQFYIPDVARIPSEHFRIAWLEALLVLTVTAGLVGAVAVSWLGIEVSEVIVPALTIGAIAVSSTPTGIAVVSRKLGTRGFLVRQLQTTPAIDGLVAIVTFGLVLAVTHEPPAGIDAPAPTPTEWVVITLGIGLVSGVLFHLFLGEERKPDRIFIAFSGAVILCSGAAAHLRLSPLLPALLMGFILVNTSPARDRLQEVLVRIERPLYFVLLIFAGAALSLDAVVWVAIALAFVLLRTLAKVGGAALAGRAMGFEAFLGARWGWGLVGHGGLAVAIALNYRLFDTGEVAGIVFASAIASVLITDLLSGRLVLSLVMSAPEAGAGTGASALRVPGDGGAGAPPAEGDA